MSQAMRLLSLINLNVNLQVDFVDFTCAAYTDIYSDISPPILLTWKVILHIFCCLHDLNCCFCLKIR